MTIIDCFLGFLAFLGSLIIACLGARLALHRLIVDKEWERKWRAYGELINALYDVRRDDEFTRRWIDSEGKLGATKTAERYSDQATTAREKLERASAIGAFVIADDAREILRGFLACREHAFDDFFADKRESGIGPIEHSNFLGTQIKACQKALDDLQRSAARDLRHPESRWPWNLMPR